MNETNEQTPGQPQAQKPESLGQYRVGISFNPSNNQAVDELKMLAATFIDAVQAFIPIPESTGPQDPYPGEVARLKALAQTNIETAAMYAVKAATKPPKK